MTQATLCACGCERPIDGKHGRFSGECIAERKRARRTQREAPLPEPNPFHQSVSPEAFAKGKATRPRKMKEPPAGLPFFGARFSHKRKKASP